jgi:hypothetical protein
MKLAAFWNVTLCRLSERYQRFEEHCYNHPHDIREAPDPFEI